MRLSPLLLLLLAAGAEAADWPAFGFDLRRCGGDGSNLDAASRVLWRYRADIPDPFMSSPSVVDGRVYVGSDGGKLYCLKATTGALLWEFNARHVVFCSPVVADGRVYVGEGLHVDEDCRLYCLDAATGKEIWAFQTQGHTEGTPLLDKGRIYFSAGPDGYYCLDAVKGTRLWHHKGPHPDSAPVLADGRLIFGTGYDKHGVYALDAATGKQLWHHPTKSPCWGTPSVRGKRVYFGTGETRYGEKVESKPAVVVCLDTETGKPVWTLDTPSAVMSAAMCIGDTVYIAAATGKVFAVDADTGKPRWTRELKQWVLASPVWAGNGLVITTQPGTVHLLDPSDGSIKKSWELCKGGDDFREGFVSSPALVGGRLYLGGLDGRVWCLGMP